MGRARTLELASTEVELFTAIGREMVLRDALSGWADRQFDVVIIDCPPTLGLLTINSLVASSRVIIPVQTQYYAIKGLTALIKVINTIKLKLNHDLEVLGLLPTFFDGRTVLAREMLENLKQLGDHRVFTTMIKNTVKLGEAPFTPESSAALFARHAAWLERALDEPHAGPTVVITHHAPSRGSIHPRFADSLLNACFVSAAERLVDGRRASLWIHGHTHDSFDYRLNGTRVLCNPRGYAKNGVNENPLFDANLVAVV